MPKIGPHNGVELELMLKGDKPLAYFVGAAGCTKLEEDEAFAPYVSAGAIKRFAMQDAMTKELVVLFYLPSEEWRANVLRIIYSITDKAEIMTLFPGAELAVIFGKMLGYSDEDIDYFVRNAD